MDDFKAETQHLQVKLLPPMVGILADLMKAVEPALLAQR